MAETLPAYQYFKFKEDLGHPEALLNEYYQLYFTPNLRLLIPVDVVNFVTPVTTAGVNWRREQATRQKFYVNKPEWLTEVGELMVETIDFHALLYLRHWGFVRYF